MGYNHTARRVLHHHDEAWYLATALAKQWDSTFTLVAALPEPLRRMTVRKACESFRVSDEHKKMLRDCLKIVK